MKKNKINQGHFLELMDRLHVQSCMIENHLIGHPLTKKIKKVKKLIDDAGWALAEAYQIIGQESIKNYEKNKTLSRRHKKPKD
jgi:hypothetical protein